MSKVDDRLNLIENAFIEIKTNLVWIRYTLLAIFTVLAGKTISELSPKVVSLFGGVL